MADQRALRSVFYPGIDGCRAVAVLGVVFFHLTGFPPAGFIGVDVFFVISGFVVAVSARTLPTKTLPGFISAFYARRLLRIGPALIVCVLATMLLDSLLVPKAWLSDVTVKTGLASLVGLSNMTLLWSANDYWSPRSEFNPFTHTWSLGVEEQFYVIAPLIFFLWARGRRRAAGIVLATLVSLSVLALIVWSVSGNNAAAFYTIAARFWELGAGVALGMNQARFQFALERVPVRTLDAVGWLAAVGLGISFVFVDPTVFPWPGAIAPVACTMVLIVLCAARPSVGIVRFLGWKPMVALGKRSYSLYLWHWPVIVLMRWTVGVDTIEQKLLAGILSIVLAWASYRWVEVPIRYAHFVKSIPRLRVIGISLVSLFSSACLVVGMTFARPLISMSVTSNKAIWTPDTRLRAARPTKLAHTSCIAAHRNLPLDEAHVQIFADADCSRSSGRTVFVAGDSHAWAYSSTYQLHTENTGDEIIVFTSPGCNVFGLRVPTASTGTRCSRFTEAALQRIKEVARPGDVLFLPSLRIQRLSDQWGGVSPKGTIPDARADAVVDAVAQLKPLAQMGVKLIFEAPKPVFRLPLFRCSDWFNRNNPDCRAPSSVPRADLEVMRAPVLHAMRDVVGQIPGSRIWDPFPLLCPGEICSPLRDGKPLFFDGDHLSAFGNALLAPSFSTAVAESSM